MLALLLAVAVLQDAQAARAESLLAVGRAHFARPVIGRYAALEAFRAAARLAPADPEPLYWQMKVGFYLGSDEGDVLARDAIVRILALRPDYEDVWDRFQRIYRNPAVWRRADGALARHPDDVIAMERRAEVAIALERPLVADSLLGEVLRRRAPYVPAYLLRAEASFDAGGDAAGYAWYDSAVVSADLDSTGAMWDAVWMIASPAEVAAHDSTPAGLRRRFFERFWARRDPNLVTPGNERIAEHFRRFAYARRYFRLLHPMNLYHRSQRYRAIIAAAQRDFLAARGRQEADPYPGAETDRLLAPGQATTSALAGLDARGLIYIRHGPPDEQVHGAFDPSSPMSFAESPLDVEGWLYHTPQGTLSIGFRRASGSTVAEVAAGDFIFLPTTRRQARSTRIALQTDRTTLPAPLEARAWSAFFKSGELGLTDVYFKTEGDSAAAVLWDAVGETVRARGRGDELLEISVPPGRYDLGFDVTANGVLGRTRREIVVPRMSLVDLDLSSLALAPGADLLDRDAALGGMPTRLVYRAGTPLSAYVEVYGLTPDRDGRSHYRVRYTFAPHRRSPLRVFGGARPVVFEFDRDVRGRGGPERLVITPDQLPPGRYRVTVDVTDLLRNVKSEAAALEVTIR
jgi:hypothetical protein